MKKIILVVLGAAVILALTLPIMGTERQNEFHAIQKAVKQNPTYEEGKEVKWFKVLVTDTKTGKDKVKITLPLALVEAFLKCADDKHIRFNRENCDIDLQDLFTQLKKLGPMALSEVTDDDALIKVWNLTQRHPGTSGAKACAGLLLGLYNGRRFPFDLTDLKLLDLAHHDAAIEVIREFAQPFYAEVHDALNQRTHRSDFGPRFEHLAHEYRLKGKCKRDGLVELDCDYLLIGEEAAA